MHLIHKLLAQPSATAWPDTHLHLIQKLLAQPSATAWPDTHLCCEWSSYGTHTTLSFPSSALRCIYSLAALAGCLGPPRLGFVLCFAVWGNLSLLLIRISKVSLLLLNLGSIPICYTKRGDVKELHFILNVSMQTIVVLQHQMFLWIFDTQFCVQGME